jgi:hypothetical protein
MAMTVINLVTPKAAAKREVLFNKPASGAYPRVEHLKPVSLNKTFSHRLQQSLCYDRNLRAKMFMKWVPRQFGDGVTDGLHAVHDQRRGQGGCRRDARQGRRRCDGHG